MLTITIQVDRPAGQAIGVKEDLAMYCERYGDVRVVLVTETGPEQMMIGGREWRKQSTASYWSGYPPRRP